MKKFFIVFISIVLVITSAFVIRDYLKFRPVEWVEGNVKKDRYEFPDDPAYEMAVRADNEHVTVFKDPLAAMKQFQTDYKSLIEQTKEEFGLNDFTRYTYSQYCLYASGVPEIILDFCYVFENSF